MSHYWPLSACIKIAKNNTSESASVKDYLLRTKRNFALRNIARNLTKGYIIATPTEMYEKYGNLFYKDNGPDKDNLFVWAITSSIKVKRRVNLGFCPIYMGGKRRSKS